jgi:hypothetical protein
VGGVGHRSPSPGDPLPKKGCQTVERGVGHKKENFGPRSVQLCQSSTKDVKVVTDVGVI